MKFIIQLSFPRHGVKASMKNYFLARLQEESCNASVSWWSLHVELADSTKITFMSPKTPNGQ